MKIKTGRSAVYYPTATFKAASMYKRLQVARGGPPAWSFTKDQPMQPLLAQQQGNANPDLEQAVLKGKGASICNAVQAFLENGPWRSSPGDRHARPEGQPQQPVPWEWPVMLQPGWPMCQAWQLSSAPP